MVQHELQHIIATKGIWGSRFLQLNFGVDMKFISILKIIIVNYIKNAYFFYFEIIFSLIRFDIKNKYRRKWHEG